MAGTVAKLLVLLSLVFPELIAGQLRLNYYAGICPDVENVVRSAVFEKFSQTAITVPAVIRLFFHDCIVNVGICQLLVFLGEVRSVFLAVMVFCGQGCDGSVLIASTAGNTAEKDHPDNLSLAGDGFDTVLKAKEAVDSVPGCRNRVSCADILALAARDAVFLGGGPWYPVELGRLDALSSTASSVDGNLPEPSFNLDQLNAMFADRGLSQADMIALSGAHTVGFAHCNRFSSRIYNFTADSPVDPTLDQQYALQLQNTCPLNPDSRVVAELDPTTPRAFDNLYFQNLVAGRGLLSSDQVLYTDPRSRGLVEQWASDPIGFNMAFVQAITKLGRVGVKNGANGNIRFDCSRFN